MKGLFQVEAAEVGCEVRVEFCIGEGVHSTHIALFLYISISNSYMKIHNSKTTTQNLGSQTSSQIDGLLAYLSPSRDDWVAAWFKI